MRYLCVVSTKICVPMKHHSTLLPTTEFAALVRKAIKQEKVLQPKTSSVRFLQDFARNYRVNANMPQGLQEYMLS